MSLNMPLVNALGKGALLGALTHGGLQIIIQVLQKSSEPSKWNKEMIEQSTLMGLVTGIGLAAIAYFAGQAAAIGGGSMVISLNLAILVILKEPWHWREMKTLAVYIALGAFGAAVGHTFGLIKFN